jgi:DNA polymerase I
MVVAVDIEDDVVRLWSRTPPGEGPRPVPGTTTERYSDTVVVQRDHDYTPTCYVAGPDEALADLRARLDADPKVAELAWARKFCNLRDAERSRVLAVSLERPSEVATFAREVRTVHEPAGRPAGDQRTGERQRREPGGQPAGDQETGAPAAPQSAPAQRATDGWAPGTFRLFDVDLGPKFRYCLETGTDPTPAADEGAAHWPRALELSLPTERQAAGDLTALSVDGERIGEGADATGASGEAAVLRGLARRLDRVDPDVLVLSSADLVPLIHERASAMGVDCQLGRLPGHRQLAGENAYESYGRVGYSAARYDVPGRAVVDLSNSFFWHEGGLPGLFDLVERSWKPLQEVSWASIGTVFTAMQIREASRRDVVVPWRAWEAETFTTARTLHDADRGGFTFEPDVGVHENVVEIDFASLYPRIMCEFDLSPETVRCGCHDTADVPGLGYSVCPDVESPFVPSVLQGVIDDRYEFKQQRQATDDAETASRLDAKISALKWILVTCFGYQGYRNSKFGRIEVHESINAHARELLLEAKAALEDAGWRVVHGIVDSLWVTPRDGDATGAQTAPNRIPKDGPEPIEQVCERITDETGIPLEHESNFEWVAFVPTSDGDRGSLTSYFGRRADPDPEESTYKYRGVEARQRSTTAFVGAVQQELVDALDEHRDPEPVCDRVGRAITRLQAGGVDPEDLVVRTRASKALADYDQRTRTVAALERYADHGVARHPGQDVRYVVVDDDRTDRDRVRLPWEDIDTYDADFYETQLVRACESVVSPLGWDRDRIRQYLADGRNLTLGAFG